MGPGVSSVTTKRSLRIFRRSAISRGWSPTMERRATAPDAKQVKCLIASEGHLWMCDWFDEFPPEVRERLANSRHNICPACMGDEAHMLARQRGERRPSMATYFMMIERIERQLDNE